MIVQILFFQGCVCFKFTKFIPRNNIPWNIKDVNFIRKKIFG